MSERVARGGAMRCSLRHPGINTDGIKESAYCMHRDEIVCPTILVDRVRDPGHDERPTVSSDRARVVHFDSHRLGSQRLTRRPKVHADEGGSRARKRGNCQPDTTLRGLARFDDNCGLSEIPSRPAARRGELGLDRLTRIAGVHYIEWHYHIIASLPICRPSAEPE